MDILAWIIYFAICLASAERDCGTVTRMDRGVGDTTLFWIESSDGKRAEPAFRTLDSGRISIGESYEIAYLPKRYLLLYALEKACAPKRASTQ